MKHLLRIRDGLVIMLGVVAIVLIVCLAYILTAAYPFILAPLALGGLAYILGKGFEG